MRCCLFGSSAAVSPATEPPQRSSCSKERVLKVGLSALFGLGGSALNGMGGYAYTQEEPEYASALVAGGVLCYTAVVVVVCCVPLTGLVKVVDKLGKVVAGAKKVEEDLEQQNKDLEGTVGRVEELTQAEQKIADEYQAQIDQIKKEHDEIKSLLSTAEKTNKQLTGIIKQFQTLLSSMQEIDKENKNLEGLIENFKTQISKVGKLSSEADETAGHVDRLDQENAELVETTEKLSSLVKNIADSYAQKRKQLEEFEEKFVALNKMDEKLLGKVTELGVLKKAVADASAELAQLNQQASALLSQLKQMGYAGCTLILPPP